MASIESPRPNNNPADRSVEEVLSRFLNGVRADYYHIDTPAERMPLEIFSLSGKTCGDCPFFTQGNCMVKEIIRSPDDLSCDFINQGSTSSKSDNEVSKQKFIKGGFKWGSTPEQKPQRPGNYDI